MHEAENQNPPIQKTRTPFEYLFYPTSIAVIGASNEPMKPGGRLIKSIKDHHFKGELWAVNPKTPDILGLPTFANIAALPGPPDLAIVAIPAGLVVTAMDELARKGTGAVIVLTSGFGEKDEQGKMAEHQMLRLSQAAGMTLIGPNCSGFITHTYKGKFAGLVPDLPGGAVDFISGSGATVDYLMEQALVRGLSFGNVVNLGNSVMIGVEDMLAMYDENYTRQAPNRSRVLMLYLESVRKPGLLLKHARSLARKGCSLVAIKSGVTEAGRRAAASHTGAMATSDAAVQALFEKAGIIRVFSRTQMIDVACALTAAGGRPAGRRACILTDAGGPGVMLADEFNRQGWDLPQLPESVRQRLSGVLPPESSLMNPIDCLPSRDANQIHDIFRILGEEQGRIDVIAVITGDSGMADNWSIYEQIIQAMDQCPIPVLPVLSSTISSRAHIQRFIHSGKVYFHDEVQLGMALGRMAACPAPAAEESATPSGYDRQAIAAALSGPAGALPPQTVRRVLEAAGFPMPAQLEIYDHAGLAAACRTIGYPLVMKVIGPLHKSDLGGVKTGISEQAQAERAWQQLMRIPGAKGVLLQPMVQGLEVILGATREGDYGHLIMFGLGGIFAEAFKDVQFALAPLSADESLRMIRGIRSYPVLEGFRGEPGMSIETLAECIQRLSRLVADFPQIDEIDLNPVKGTGTDLVAVDARILQKNN